MPRSSSTEGPTSGLGGAFPPPPSVPFSFNTKLEFDDDDDFDGMAELDAVSSQDRASGSFHPMQKPEPGSGPSSGTSAKRKRPLKLTPHQRERKRAIDREAQRSIRIKTKNYIAHLENLVKVMEQSDTTGPDRENTRTRELMNQLKHSQDEVRAMREAMLSVSKTLSTVLSDPGNLHTDQYFQQQSSHSDSPSSATEIRGNMPFVGPANSPGQYQQVPVPPPPQLQRDHSSISIPPLPSQKESLIPNPPNMPERPKPSGPRRFEGELAVYAEFHLNRVYTAGPAAFNSSAYDEDIPVRAVLEGWTAVEERHVLDLCWQVIREIDQVVWINCGIIERMAILRFVRTKLFHQVNARSSRVSAAGTGMPDFMTTEVAPHSSHADIVDTFIWPGFRHCLVEQPHKYISNHFSDKFRFGLKFLWPFDVSSAYTKDPATDMYTSTNEFVSRQWDVRCWAMRGRFFEGNEELRGMIPCCETGIQKSLSMNSIERGQATGGGLNVSGLAGHRGLVEDQELDDGGGVGGETGIVDHAGVGVGVGGGWQQGVPQQHSQQQGGYWNMTSVGNPVSGMDYIGLVSVAGQSHNGYSM